MNVAFGVDAFAGKNTFSSAISIIIFKKAVGKFQDKNTALIWNERPGVYYPDCSVTMVIPCRK